MGVTHHSWVSRSNSPIQLTHCDGLGVEHVIVDSFVHATTNGWLPFQQCHGSCQDSVTLGNHHHKVTLLASSESRDAVGWVTTFGSGEGSPDIRGVQVELMPLMEMHASQAQPRPCLALLTLLLPEPVGPTSMRPCRTTVVSYSWMHLIRKPRGQGRGTRVRGWNWTMA